MVGFGCLSGRWWDEGGGDRLVGLAVWGRWCVKMGWVSVAAGRWRAGMRVCWRVARYRRLFGRFAVGRLPVAYRVRSGHGRIAV